MAIMLFGKNPKIVLRDSTTLEIDEEFKLIWIHPDGFPTEHSYRLNLNFKMVDVHRTPQENVKN